MQRGKLFRTPLAAQDRLTYLREILDWAYAEGRSPRQLQVGFWEWFIGATHEQATREWRASFNKIYPATVHWDWPRIQRELREAFGTQVANVDKPRLTPAPRLLRRVGTWTARDKSRYYQYGPVMEKPLNQDQAVALALDQMLTDLSGLAVEVLGQCEQCARWFVRVRGTRKRFCSQRCTWRAFQARDRERSKTGRRVPVKAGKR